MAKQVLGNQGYDGAAADVWSCGVILYVLMAGYLPFDDADLPSLFRKVFCHISTLENFITTACMLYLQVVLNFLSM